MRAENSDLGVPEGLGQFDDIELPLLVVAVARHLHPGAVLQAQLHLLLVDLHVEDVEGDVVRGLSDVDVDEDLSVNGEIIRDEEGNEIEFIPDRQSNKIRIKHNEIWQIPYLDGLMLAGSLTSISSSVGRPREGETEREIMNINSIELFVCTVTGRNGVKCQIRKEDRTRSERYKIDIKILVLCCQV